MLKRTGNQTRPPLPTEPMKTGSPSIRSFAERTSMSPSAVTEQASSTVGSTSNEDGDWDDPGEKVFADQPVTHGANNLQITVPGGAILGSTFARFRLTGSAGYSYHGLAPSGEVRGLSSHRYRSSFRCARHRWPRKPANNLRNVHVESNSA